LRHVGHNLLFYIVVVFLFPADAKKVEIPTVVVSEFLCILLSYIGFLLRDAWQRASSTVAEGVSCILFFLAFYMADVQPIKACLLQKKVQVERKRACSFCRDAAYFLQR
jgi:hypothetical protein